MITLANVSKTYGAKLVVDNVSFSLTPGIVTGLLGPNGAGKSTTMRMIAGLHRPSAGSITVAGSSFRESAAPMRTLGTLLDAEALDRGRTPRNHLYALAATNGIPKSRADAVLEQVGLGTVAGRRVKTFSLGMRQRLGIATALLGDPAILMLDEPVNGLDPEGVHWVRQLVRSLAANGTTVLISSHLMAEMALTADHLIVIGRGRVLADAPTANLIDEFTRSTVTVRAPHPTALLAAVQAEGGVTVARGDAYELSGVTVARVGELALQTQTVLHELIARHGSLEDAFLELTKSDVEYASAGTETVR